MKNNPHFYRNAGAVLAHYQHLNRAYGLPAVNRKSKVDGRSLVMKYLVTVLKSSSMHGFNQLAKTGRHPMEYGMWAGWLIACLVAAALVFRGTYMRYQENPTVVSMERNYHDWNTSLPAITLCPDLKTEPLALNQTAEALFSDLFAGMEWLEALSNATFQGKLIIPELEEVQPQDYLEALMRIALNFTYVLSNSNSVPAQLMPVLTELGLCYMYNSLVSPYLNPEYWKQNNWTLLEGIDIFVGSPLEGDIFAQIMEMNSAYKVAVHSPGEVADSATKLRASPLKHYKSVELTALSTYPSPAIGGLSIKQRKCRFSQESELSISPFYSYQLCRMECRKKLSFSLCGCAPHFYRPSNRRVCDSYGLRCLSKRKDHLIKLRNEDNKPECNCLPPCDDVYYSVSSESTVEWFLGTNFKYGLIEYPRFRLKRDILFGFSDLLVQFGGTVGLFLGCSVLSIFEILYFSTIRGLVHVFLQNRREIFCK